MVNANEGFRPVLFPRSSARILMAHDFSRLSDLALDYAIDLAVEQRGRIRLVHILELEAGKTNPGAEALTQARRFNCEQRLETAVARCALRGVNSEAHVRSGVVPEGLQQEVKEWDPQLLFLGAYGEHDTDRPCLGSTAESLLRTLPCPVVAIGPKTVKLAMANDAPRTMICPIDFPNDINERLKMIVDLARTLGATVKLIHAIDVSQELSRPHSAADMQFEFDMLVGRLLQAGVIAEARLLYGDPEKEISRYAREQEASCILFGLHHEGKASSYYQKSLVARVIRNAPCPTWTFAQRINPASRKPMKTVRLESRRAQRKTALVENRDNLSYQFEN